MVGMLVGISGLTTIGLARFYAVEADTPGPADLCPSSPAHCPAYTSALKDAGLAQLHAVFAGAAGCAALAAVLALVLLRAGAGRPRSLAHGDESGRLPS
jgi:hypothetical protein